MGNPVIAEVRQALAAAADEKTKAQSGRFFREAVRVYGTKTATVGKIARDAYRKIGALPKSDIFALCADLMASGFCEESWIAADWAYATRDRFEPGDFAVLEGWIDRYIDNWAECDTLCNHTVGSFVTRYPEFIRNLYGWTSSGNRWKKRAAAVTLIVPAKTGMFLDDALSIADRLLTDPDDMVQKGYGWLLKEESRTHRDEIFCYVVKHKSVMPRTALRYAIELMPDNLRRKAMER
jgi:3-methyladenine DNA glycosylase AlkD